MGECDRLKHYISDYLDNTLDPSTHKEFEEALKNSTDLKSMTHRVSVLKSQLNNLPNQTCSENFSLKLRERIHTEPQPVISRQNMVRLSFAASFVLILVIATFTLNNFSDSDEIGPAVQKSSESPNQTPNPVSSNNNNVIANDSDELDVKTKNSQETYQDSTRTNKSKDTPYQQVDDQK